MNEDDARHLLRSRCSRRVFLIASTAIGVASSVLGLTGCGGTTASVVTMDDRMQFMPSTLTIRAGETVTWRNKSTSMVHTVTADPDKVRNPASVSLPDGVAPWDSGLLTGGQHWQHTFDQAGEYRYCCVPHESIGMTGIVTVEG